MDAHWGIEHIAAVLGGKVEQVGRPTSGVYAIRLHNERLGVRLKLELVPEQQVMRLFVDRDRKTRPSFLGRIDLLRVAEVEVDERLKSVTFRSNHGQPCELGVSATGVVRVVIGGVLQ